MTEWWESWESWESWKDADPRDVELARALVPWSSVADDLVILEEESAIGVRTPMGDARVIFMTGHRAPRPLWTFFLSLAIKARELASK